MFSFRALSSRYRSSSRAIVSRASRLRLAPLERGLVCVSRELAPNRFSADLLIRPMCTKGSSSYASSSFARARSAARSRPNDPSFARPFDDAAAAVRDDAPARARDARARDARTRTASRIVARAAGRAVGIARALCTAHARRAAACEHAIASRSGASLFHFAARTTRAPRRRCACSTRWIGSNARPENNTSNSIVTTCLRVRLSRRAPSHGRRELRFAQANRFRCHFYEFICTYVSDSALEIYYLRWRQSNRFVVAARTHIC